VGGFFIYFEGIVLKELTKNTLRNSILNIKLKLEDGFMHGNKIYREKLANEYKKIFLKGKIPKWAVRKIADSSKIVHPAIPFVGENYEKTKLIVYASAENLNFYKRDEDGYLDNDKKAIYRRYNDEKAYFPGLHCGPIGCGQLLIVSAYVLKKLKYKIIYNNPHEFISNIAADNFGKFSIVGEKNRDYAGNIDYLKSSFKYIEADLKILQPEIIILPDTIYRFDEVKKLIKKLVPSCLCIPIYQMFAQNINHKKRISKYLKRKEEDVDPILLKWHKKIPNNMKENFYSVYNYLDKIINSSIKNSSK
jgi:hypothetical protein